MKKLLKIKPIEQQLNPISPGVEIGHVHLKTANLQCVYDFYVGILGFNVMFRMPTAIFLSAGGYHHHLAFNIWESKDGSPPPINSTGLYHVAIRYPARADLGDALRRLTAHNWPLEGVNDHGTHEALYLRDPDDNGLELYWDRPQEDWPIDSKGHLVFGGSSLDIDSLRNEGKE